LVRLGRLFGLTTLALFTAAPAALADASSSSNWAGYAAYRNHGEFHRVFASWTQPSLTCTPGQSSYSAFWVGLGGYSVTSKALEQVGTEADCKRSGVAKMGAWYELVPAPSRSVSLQIRAGDRIAASVSVSGHEVSVRLQDVTTGKSMTKRIRAATVDLSSAEWIAEAPSDCINSHSCQTLPLADFGSAAFDLAGAQLMGAHRRAISSGHWKLTKIILQAGRRQFAGLHGAGTAGGQATPSALTDRGSAFTVTYSTLTTPSSPPLVATDVRTVIPGS
jgi:hypothetical protein